MMAVIPIEKSESYNPHAWQALLRSVEIKYSSEKQQFTVIARQLGASEEETYSASSDSIETKRARRAQEKEYFALYADEMKTRNVKKKK